jgi:ubiquinone/menaquinone biosynthesis C-methylase UbiE
VLEIGVGTGVVSLGLQELGHQVVGIDLSEGMLRHARRRIGPVVVAGDAARLPIADSSVAQALIVWVLHVVGDITRAMREVGRVLRPGGRVLVVPALDDRPADPIGRIIRKMQEKLDPTGRRSDQERRVRSEASASGLRLTEARDLRTADYEESPAQAIQKLQARSYSILWDLPEDRWLALVEPAIAALRALPNPERPIVRRSSGRLLVFTRVQDAAPEPGGPLR